MLFDIANALTAPCQGVSVQGDRITFWDATCREYGIRCSLTGTVTLYREGYDSVRIGAVSDGAPFLAHTVGMIVRATF